MSFKISLHSGESDNVDYSSNFRGEHVDQDCIVISILSETACDRMLDGNYVHYLKDLVFHVRMRDIEGRPCSFYVVFNLTLIEIVERQILILLPKTGNLDVDFSNGRHNCKKELVFIGVVDVSDDGKRVYGKPIKGITVRLHRIDSREQECANWSEITALVGIRSAVPNREGELLGSPGKATGESVLEQRPKSVIESTSQVMNDIRDHQGPTNDWGLIMDLDDETCAGVLRINVGVSTVGFGVYPSANFSVESVEQFFGSADLPVGT